MELVEGQTLADWGARQPARKPGPTDLGFAALSYGLLHVLRDDLETGLRHMRIGLASMQPVYEPSNDNILSCRHNLGHALIIAGHTAEAQRVLEAGIEAARKEGRLTSQVADLRAQQGYALLTEGRAEAALRAYQEAFTQHQKAETVEEGLAFTLHGLGSASLALGRADRAVEYLERAFKVRPPTTSADLVLRANIPFVLARALRARGLDRARACALARDAAAGYRSLQTSATGRRGRALAGPREVIGAGLGQPARAGGRG